MGFHQPRDSKAQFFHQGLEPYPLQHLKAFYSRKICNEHQRQTLLKRIDLRFSGLILEIEDGDCISRFDRSKRFLFILTMGG